MVPKLLSLFLLAVLCESIDVNSLKLKQVLILSRHNVRYSLGEHLPRYSPRPWPKRKGEAGLLTPRGAQLEGYMGEYFSEWFKKEQFLPEGCPGEDTVYVYSNTISRTKATAKAFVESAFKHCNVTVHHQNTEKPDPLFNPVIHNTTEDYKNKVFEEIYRKINNNPKLKAAYSELNKILDIKYSDICKRDSICDLTEVNSTILYEVGKEVWVNGPLSIGNSAIDSFIMSFYDGLPLQEIAWGRITTPEKWKLLTEIGRQDQFIRYTTVAEDFGAPLLKNLTNIFKNYSKLPKLMLIVGHDYTLNSVWQTFGFKSITDLPNQYEKFPIGGKFVFQRWTDNKNDYLKTEYIYPTWSQVRNATELTLENPPQRVLMQLNWCHTDKNGFCLWNEFVNNL